MTDNKADSQIHCASCGHLVSVSDDECPTCGFGLRTQQEPLEVGVVLESRYRIDGVVGRGGTGVVYKGTDLTLSRAIAVKALLEKSADPVTLARFLHEARNLASVEHPGLVPVYAVGQEHGAHYMVMKYIDGSTLAELIKEQGPLPEATVTQILIEACDALTTLHTAGLIHRDLKPANLMIGRDGRVSVVDLGIVQRVTEKHEASGQAAGTPKYMAPEMFSDEDVTYKADIYSLGIVGFHSLAGRPPFDGPTPMAILYKQAHEKPPTLQKLAPGVSQHVASVIHKAISKQPNERFESAAQFAEALQKKSSTGRLATVIAIATIAAALALFFVQKANQPQSPARQPVDTGVVSSTVALQKKALEEKASELVKVEVQAGVPEQVQLHLPDGSVVESPYSLEKVKGAPPITIRAAAKDFEDREYVLNFEQNAQVAIILKKKPTPPRIKSGRKTTPFKPLGYED